jgi:hypothetical protein
VSAHRSYKWAFLLLWWACGLTIAIFWGTDVRFSIQTHQHAQTIGDYAPRKNHMEASGLIQRDPTRNYRPLYLVYFDELWTEGGKLGIFKTGIYKIAKVNGLELKLFQYYPEKKPVPENVVKAEKPVANNNQKDTCSTQHSSKQSQSRSSMSAFGNDQNGYSKDELFDELLEKVKKLSGGCQFNSSEESSGNLCDGWKLTIPGIELSDIGEICVSDFDYQFFYDGELSFGVQGKRVIASYKQPDVILRGHVIITASGGSTLECNYAKWNVKKELFKVDGVYVLNRKGETISGKGVCVDTQLNSVGVQLAGSKKGIKKCFVKL